MNLEIFIVITLGYIIFNSGNPSACSFSYDKLGLLIVKIFDVNHSVS